MTPKTHAQVPLAPRHLAVHAERAVLTHRRADGGVAAMKRNPGHASRVPRERRVRVKRRRRGHQRRAQRASGTGVRASTNQLLHRAHVAATRRRSHGRVDARECIVIVGVRAAAIATTVAVPVPVAIAVAVASSSTCLRAFGRGVQVRADVAEREERVRRARGGGDVQRRSTEFIPRVFLRRAMGFREGSKRGDAADAADDPAAAPAAAASGVRTRHLRVGIVGRRARTRTRTRTRTRARSRARTSTLRLAAGEGVEHIPEQKPNHVGAIVRGGDVKQRRAVRWKSRRRVRARVHE